MKKKLILGASILLLVSGLANSAVIERNASNQVVGINDLKFQGSLFHVPKLKM
jgi:hypothetical protein